MLRSPCPPHSVWKPSTGNGTLHIQTGLLTLVKGLCVPPEMCPELCFHGDSEIQSNRQQR